MTRSRLSHPSWCSRPRLHQALAVSRVPVQGCLALAPRPCFHRAPSLWSLSPRSTALTDSAGARCCSLPCAFCSAISSPVYFVPPLQPRGAPAPLLPPYPLPFQAALASLHPLLAFPDRIVLGGHQHKLFVRKTGDKVMYSLESGQSNGNTDIREFGCTHPAGRAGYTGTWKQALLPFKTWPVPEMFSPVWHKE